MRAALVLALLAIGFLATAAPADASGAIVCYPWPFGGGAGCTGAEPLPWIVVGCWGYFTEIYFGMGGGAAVCV